MVYVFKILFFRSVIFGKFAKGVLISGRFGQVVGSSLNNGVVYPKSGHYQTTEFTFDPSTSSRISKFPLLADPWEFELVEVRDSDLLPGQHGLFAKVDLEDGIVFSLFQACIITLHPFSQEVVISEVSGGET